MDGKTIDDVIRELGEITHWAENNSSRLGYFPALYRMVTIRIKEGIEKGDFEDGARMENLDVVFANRYIDAYHAWSSQKPCSKSWEITFDAADKWRYIVLQHLFIGMNAHINLDLAIAAAEVAPGDKINALETDFKSVTGILNDLTDGVQKDLAEIWPMLKLLSRAGDKFGDWVSGLGMKVARDRAWENAVRLAKVDAAEKEKQIKHLDQEVASLGEIILSPPFVTNTAIRLARLGEWKSVPKIIQILSN